MEMLTEAGPRRVPWGIDAGKVTAMQFTPCDHMNILTQQKQQKKKQQDSRTAETAAGHRSAGLRLTTNS